jgi:AraC family transcriptional regulator, transcriptional activator of pobA
LDWQDRGGKYTHAKSRLFINFVNMTEMFKIFSVTPVEAEKIGNMMNEPHHHDFEELIIGVEGQLEHFIDFKTTLFDAPFVSFITKGKVHRVRPVIKNEKCLMWVIGFKSEFIAETTFQLYSYYHDHANIALKTDCGFSRLVSLCEMINEESLQKEPSHAVIRQLLSTLFVMIEAERKKLQPTMGAQKTQSITFSNFLKILEENFRRPEGVDFYAEKLFMTSRNLNIICQNIIQQTVSEIIETRKLLEAKNLLVTTEMTISEIGFELGYNEKSYFTNVFKKKTGQTPTEFREEMKKLLS